MNMNVFKLKINQVCEIEQSICKSQLNLQTINRPKNQWKIEREKRIKFKSKYFWFFGSFTIYKYTYTATYEHESSHINQMRFDLSLISFDT